MSVIGDEINWSWLDGLDDPSPTPPKTAVRRSRGRPRTRNPPPLVVPPHILERQRRGDIPVNITKEGCDQAREEERRDAIGWAMFHASKEGRNTANNDRRKEKHLRIIQLYRDNAELILDYSLSVTRVTDIILRERDSLGLGRRALWGAIKKSKDPGPEVDALEGSQGSQGQITGKSTVPKSAPWNRTAPHGGSHER